jgi:hypothetical protein
MSRSPVTASAGVVEASVTNDFGYNLRSEVTTAAMDTETGGDWAAEGDWGDWGQRTCGRLLGNQDETRLGHVAGCMRCAGRGFDHCLGQASSVYEAVPHGTALHGR